MEQNRDTICEIVRGEYFSGASEPTITIKKPTVRFNANCLKKLPDIDYVLFVIYRSEKKLVIKPCSPGLRDAVRWSSVHPDRRKPKTITCKEFFRRILELMHWNEDCRYRIIGKVSEDGDGKSVIAFDLSSALIFNPDATGRISREPAYPKDWANGFGMTVADYNKNPLLKRFPEDTDIILQSMHEDGKLGEENDMENENEQEL